MKKYMVWLISVIMAISMTACTNTEKKDTKDQAVTTTSVNVKDQKTKEKIATTAKQTSKKKKNKKDKKKKQDKKTAKSTVKKDKSKKATTKKKKTSKKKKTTKNSNVKNTSTNAKETTVADHAQAETTTQASKNETIVEEKKEEHCEFLISCKTVLSHKDDLQSNYQIPSGGKIYEKTMKFEEGDTVMDVLKRTGVDIDVSKGYVAGIDGLYEFDCGKNSGWMYRVNGKFPNYMAGKCKLHDGDKVEWLYTCVRGDL